MASVRVTVDIAAPGERAWQAVADVEHWPCWTTSMGDVKRLDEGPPRVGSRARIKQPGLPVFVWEVTDLDKGTSFTWVTSTLGIPVPQLGNVGTAAAAALHCLHNLHADLRSG